MFFHFFQVSFQEKGDFHDFSVSGYCFVSYLLFKKIEIHVTYNSSFWSVQVQDHLAHPQCCITTTSLQYQNCFHHPRRYPLNNPSPFLLSSGNCQSAFFSMNVPILGISCKRNCTICAILCLVYSLRMSLRLIQVVACTSISFVSMAKLYSMVQIHHRFLIRLSTDGHLGCSTIWVCNLERNCWIIWQFYV